MKLDGILQGNQALLYMERYVDEGTRTYSPFAARSEAAPEYQPRSGRTSFELITVFAPQSQVSIFKADPHRNILEFYVLSEQVRFLIPYFALYGGDLRHPEDRPLLVQMIERLGAEPQSFVIGEIMIPVLDCWAKVVRERGILLESHAQNLLLEIDSDFRPRRVVHRDFDVWVAAETRNQAGLGGRGASS